MLIILDYGMGNLRSVQNKVERLGFESLISANPQDLAKASKIILPGVGHFGKAMQNLKERSLIEPLEECVLGKKIPVLGICLGMQILCDSSEEGEAEGLGWIKARTVQFDVKLMDKKRKVPHMGWNSVENVNNTQLLKDIEPSETFYFVHSYHLSDVEEQAIAMQCTYGYKFVCAVEKENIFGVQFHPEKSHQRGSQMIRNFVTGA